MFVWVIKMLQYDRIDASEGFDINKRSESKEWKNQNITILNVEGVD